jgi:nicotinic acetylcholine receptor, invertebrate
VSPTFEKPVYREVEKTVEASRFVAQHVKNKDKFESVSTNFPFFNIFNSIAYKYASITSHV